MKRATLPNPRLLLLAIPLVLLPALASPRRLAGGDLGFMEDFALSTDREEALQRLIPGTEDYYFYHCLQQQNGGKLDVVDRMLATWIERHGRTARVEEMENRQALLRYPGDPRKSLDLLRARLGLRFDHQREVLGEDPRLPTSLDPKAVSREAFTQRALERRTGTTDGFEERALEWAASLPLDPDRRRHLLSRLRRPDVPDLPRLVVDDLRHKGSGGFGSHEIHRRLLRAQLDECLKLHPGLLNEAKFVETYLPRLLPDADTDLRADAKAREAYLERLWAFVSRLNASHNSLKAHVLYHRLAHDRALGVHDKARFLAYLGLPRNTPYVSRAHLERAENRRAIADLNANYQPVTQLPAVKNDEPLVRAYLEHFFLTEDTHAPYEAYLNDQYLKRVFAETKVMAGLGNVETWASMLPPADYQALQERVDLEFAPTNRSVFGPEEAVSLDLNVKGVRRLIVKVFEVNTLNYYRDSLKEIDTAIDLDGLVANEETTHDYAEPPIRRVKRHFEFPSLSGRGAYVIDFIGGGKSSRALIQKGRLRFLERASTAGHVITVLDESGTKLPDASLWLGGRRYAADGDGLITVPFSTEPRRQPIVLAHGDFAVLESLEHQAEAYALAAGFHVEREALLSRAKAQVLVRPSLLLNFLPVTLAVLEEPALEIRSADRDGVETVVEVKDFKLFEDRESVHEFQVPANLARIAFKLKAKVQSLSRGKREDLEASRSFDLNGID
ncbi:MAG TPA: hypothetical protein VMT52_17610, partial [Planctomycetota bacterium]|nr:hypothetical protein [Planctomycetota bacterium]